MRLTALKTPNYNQNVLTSVTFTNTGSAPVTASDVKAWDKIDYTAEDSLISDTIDEVIDTVEREYNFTIIDKTVTAIYESYSAKIYLPYAPVSSITTLEELDEGTATAVDSDDYFLQGDVLYLAERFLTNDPFLSRGLKVVYDCSWSTLPAGIKLGLKKAIISNINDREDLVGGMNIVELPNGSRSKFERYRNYA